MGKCPKENLLLNYYSKFNHDLLSRRVKEIAYDNVQVQ